MSESNTATEDGVVLPEQDLDQPNGEGQDVAPVNSRQAQLEEIAARNRAERDDGGEEDIDPEPPEGGSSDDPDEGEDAPKSPVFERDGKFYSTIKVNGEETEMSVEDMIRTTQKNLAADQRLQSAAQREQELAAREQALFEREQSLADQASQPPADAGADDADEVIANTVKAIYEGDEDAIGDGLRSLVARQQQATPTLDAAEVDRRVRESLAVHQQQVAAEAAVAHFRENNPDIADDPHLWDLADKETVAIAEENPNATLEEVFDMAADKVRVWLKGRAPDSSESRQNRKRSAAEAVKATSRRSNVGTDPAPRQKTGDVIADMRARRGQQV